MQSVLTVILLSNCFLRLPFLGLALRHSFRERIFYKLDGMSLIGNVTEETKVSDLWYCVILCLEYGPLSCLSFNFNKTKDTRDLHDCHLINSEKFLKPQQMQERPSFDYYGTPFEFLARFFPCLTSPCRNGGTCVSGSEVEVFSCDCPLEIKALPYTDGKCNVDNSLIKVYVNPPVEGVFLVAVGTYRLNYFEAQRLCQIHEATLASLDQLTQAWQAGLELCRAGWLNDGRVAYPMKRASRDCGGRSGIIDEGIQADKKNTTFDAWCFQK
ncbi:stabilin-2-like [Montipora foliosa]|uniref:stabilin-2-like n=1 Tax=Montipora foliosa TaxID=591990 RepID=UPI0035F14CD7